MLVCWKDGSSTWITLKDLKQSYPVEVAEYAAGNKINKEPAFAWWIPHVMKHRNQIIGKVKSKYWLRTHKYGIETPKSVVQAYLIDKKNGNTLWRDAINKEMKNVRSEFDVYDGDINNLPPGYQQINCHIIFDVKFGEDFRRKARFVAGGHTTKTPSVLTYSSVVLRDSVGIALLLAVLNRVDCIP